jgi:hypothetical protein
VQDFNSSLPQMVSIFFWNFIMLLYRFLCNTY